MLLLGSFLLRVMLGASKLLSFNEDLNIHKEKNEKKKNHKIIAHQLRLWKSIFGNEANKN